MTPAALVLTLLFVADDPQVPSVVVDVVEDATGRRVDVVVVGAGSGFSSSLRDGPAEGSRQLRSWPLMPRGASLTPAADGLVLTIDDAGAWQPAATTPTTTPTTTGTPKKAPKPPTNPAPALPVANDRSLRLFLPSVVDERPATASLHGTRTRATGSVLILQRPAASVALTVSGVEADGGDALVTGARPVCGGAPMTGANDAAATTVVQALTRSVTTSIRCGGTLVVATLAGKRFGDRPDKDKEARGLLVQHRQPDTVK